MNDARYVIDTCSLTKMRHTYPKDVFPTAWAKLTEISEAGVIISAEDVLEELSAFDDEVLEWAQGQSEFFYPLDQKVQRAATDILGKYPGLLDLKKNKSSGDPFIIATALCNKCSVVTEEKFSNSPVRPKIPNVCKAVGVECITIVDMFRREGLRV
ncbi:DUF4411 family protein [Halomonas saccharevitans]|uniref:DUF4411 family protein n=1 Tax=Halomonas saccharevitans TaxID=416872 RepID=A0ABU3NC45_9GAMM|nr:DUF4411 family protein [Halomonas saccharevitans]MDT8878749.1 DUF4411 family protein [Halomonas saccharevitans]